MADAHEGEWLKREILQAGVSIAAFARRAHVSRELLNKWFTQQQIAGRLDSKIRVLRALDFDTDVLLGGQGSTEMALGAEGGQSMATLTSAAAAERILRFAMSPVRGGAARRAAEASRDPKLRLAGGWDANVEPYHQEHIPYEIPTFDLPVAAGGWSHVTDNHTGGITCTAEQRRQGLFRVRIRGDSMEPRFVDGDLVEFKLLCTSEGLPDFERMREGEAYYVQKHDGEGTFKICRKIEPDHIELVAINKDYKKPLTAMIEEIVSVGRYEYKLSK